MSSETILYVLVIGFSLGYIISNVISTGKINKQQRTIKALRAALLKVKQTERS